MALGLALMAAWLEPTGTRQAASAFRTLSLKDLRFRTENGHFGVTRTTKSQRCTDCIYPGKLRMDISPHWNIQISFSISNKIHAVLGSAEEHVDAVLSA
jgi:hypothetical protein